MAVNDLAASLEGTGFYSLVLPFVLVFAIVYGLLNSLDLFGNDKPNVLISAVLAIFATFFFPMGEILAVLEGPWALWLILFLMVMITITLVWGNPQDGIIGKIMGVVAVLGVLILFVIPGRGEPIEAIFGVDFGGLTASLATIPVIGPFIADVGLTTILLVLLMIGAVIWMVRDGGGG